MIPVIRRCPYKAKKYRGNVNAALAQLCLERGFTILDSLVDSWPGFLSRDIVHPSWLGNKVLADFFHREACALSTHLERRCIQQSYKESKASAVGGLGRSTLPSTWKSIFLHLVAPPEKEGMMCTYESPYIHSSAVTLVLCVDDCALTLPTVARDMAEII
ncbi:uncharacterized protein LOC119178659 isoform X9 [Rhipicephalus microplus]|uniref:uncharacterized protein LOC119178659 isoform X9 n=1 Tax=Rhipicephalus microplus TaxID=6941 RepID=UPI003F6CBDDE